MKILKKKQSGFTLLEMSIVLFIISLLVLIMLPNLSQQRKHANSIHGKAMTSVIQTQIDAYENSSLNCLPINNYNFFMMGLLNLRISQIIGFI